MAGIKKFMKRKKQGEKMGNAPQSKKVTKKPVAKGDSLFVRSKPKKVVVAKKKR